ncbi:MAG: hypothetical protein IAG13_38290 [Deltaproteobacteria bacterium]|nr:hypothetical protein [Nannocystaceae bacterium]
MKTQWICSVGVCIGSMLGVFATACDRDEEEGNGDGRCYVSADCRGGERCDSGFCVAIETEDGDTDDSEPDDSGPNDSGPNDSGPNDSGPNDSGPNDSGPDDSGPDDSGPDDSGPDDSGPAPGCEEGEFSCVVDHIEACTEGEWEQFTCSEVCAAQGYTSSGCSDAQQCACDGFADQACATGVAGFCTCLESAGESCSDEDFISFYQSCFAGSAPEFACFSYYVSNGQIDCTSAVEACL